MNNIIEQDAVTDAVEAAASQEQKAAPKANKKPRPPKQRATSVPSTVKAKSGKQSAASKKAPKTAKSAKAAKSARPVKPAEKREGVREGSKTAKVLDLLKRPDGATLKEIMRATGWQAHSVRGFMSGTISKKMGLNVTSSKEDDGERNYSLK